MRWTNTLLLCTIALITLSALFLSYAHATTTVNVTPESGGYGTTFTATATTNQTVPVNGYCMHRWYEPGEGIPFRTTTTYATEEKAGWSVDDSWQFVADPTGNYTVKARFYDAEGTPLEAGSEDTFEALAVPVFPLGLIFPIIALIVFFVVVDKKFMKPHDASTSQFLSLRRSCGASTNRNSIH